MDPEEIGEYIWGLLSNSIGYFLTQILSMITDFLFQSWDLIVEHFLQQESFIGEAPVMIGVILVVVGSAYIGFYRLRERRY